MSTPRVLVAGIGNVLLGDDGFGVEVVRHLIRAPAPAGVAVVDYGVRGMHLAYDLCDGYDDVVMVDALGRGGVPGTVSVLDLSGAGEAEPPRPEPPRSEPPRSEPPRSEPPRSEQPRREAEPAGAGTQVRAQTAAATGAMPGAGTVDAHGMQPQAVLDLLALLGGELGRVLLVGCEPASLDHRIGLSPPVARAVRPAAVVTRSLAQSLVPKEVGP